MRPGVQLLLGIAIAVLLALALRSTVVAWWPNHLALPHGPKAVPSASPQVVAAAFPVVTAGPAAPATVLSVQLASFLDPRNAARMVQQLQHAGWHAETRVIDGHRVRYRIHAVSEDGENAEASMARLRRLGFKPQATNGTVAVTGFVSIDEADQAASRLEEHRIGVRVERESRAVSYHVVRVGAYRSFEAAELARVELAARGLAGVVVEEQEATEYGG